MTLGQFESTVRRRHNAESDTFFSADEIYELITNRCNEVLSIIGLIEATTTDTSVADQQAYDYPSDAVNLRQVNYKADRLKRIGFRHWELFKTDTSTETGTPNLWVPWERKINMVPIPDTAGDTITIYYYKEHPYIDNDVQTTIDIPSVLHAHLVHGVLSDMFVKDLNNQMASLYEDKWLNVSVPAFHRFKAQEENSTAFSIVGDADTENTTGVGIE